jgi:hypothetical protein
MDRWRAIEEPLRESKSENMADMASCCAEILAGTQLGYFEGLGKISRYRTRLIPAQATAKVRCPTESAAGLNVISMSYPRPFRHSISSGILISTLF